VPVRHFPRTAGSPTGAHPWVIARAFVELFQLRMRLARDAAGRSPVRRQVAERAA
jgi:hypothetical protein